MALILDDHLLLDHLAGRLSGWVSEAASRTAVYTTGSWYYRAANAAWSGSGRGTLSGRIMALPEADRLGLHEKLAAMPSSIGLIGPRALVPIMAALRTPRRLNHVSAEAVALAVATEATIAVRTDSALLREGCEALQIDYRLAPAG